MGTFIILLVIAVIIILAVKSSIKHIRGEGGCCGGDSEKIKPKKLDGNIIAQKIVKIDGMHCSNCKNTVERRINSIDGASAKVNLRKNIAVVSMTRNVSDDEIRKA
jgi:copper chaperone CopZ